VPLKDYMISVIIPALNEAAHIAKVVEFARRSPLVKEVIVVDDGSVDETVSLAKTAGATVITSTHLGKGVSMQDGLRKAQEGIILYLDGDLEGLRADLIERMTDPIQENKADFVKARFTRQGGRVTVLTARPLLRTFFAELSNFEQPLGGIICAKRQILEQMSFEPDYGVDVGLLIDAWSSKARIKEVDIGHIENDSQRLEVLGDMATQVVRAILKRAARHNRLDAAHIREVLEIERRMQSEISVLLARVADNEKIALFDMDGVLLDGRYVEMLAARADRQKDIAIWLDNPSADPVERARHIAAAFAGIPKSMFEETARQAPLTRGAVDTVIALRKSGYRVGIVTDSYFVASEIICRRVFADFSAANMMKFVSGFATGELIVSPAMQRPTGCPKHEVCKLNVLLNLCDKTKCDLKDVVAVGDGDNDICLLEAVGKSIAFKGKTAAVRKAARYKIRRNLNRVVDIAIGRRTGLRRFLPAGIFRSGGNVNTVS
jgi:glucosyl-3-phosphoglycerate synthase